MSSPLIKLYYLLILGSCKSLNLDYSGCCITSLSRTCTSTDCQCDQLCHSYNDCCSDIADIGCHPVSYSSPTVSTTPTDTFGKTKS